MRVFYNRLSLLFVTVFDRLEYAQCDRWACHVQSSRSLLTPRAEEIRILNLKEVATLMEEPKVFVEGRNVLDAEAALKVDLLYRCFGRG
jgi:hypothetical protein